MIGIVLSVAFLAGVLLRDSGVGIVLAIPVLGGGLVAALLAARRGDRLLVFSALVMLALGIWRAPAGAGTTAPILAKIGADRAIDATVVGIPRRETTRVAAKVRLVGPNRQSLAVSLPLYPTVASGDEIRFWAPNSWNRANAGMVVIPTPAGARPVFIPAFEVERSSTSTMTRLRSRVNDAVTSAIERYVPEPAGALALGIMNGDDSGMTEATRQRFQSSGMSHITAVSGWNVALVAGLMSLFTRRLAPTSLLTLVAEASVVWTYAFLVGMGPSVVRAGSMATVFLAARWRGRPGDLVTSILLSVATIVALTPSIRFDIGFQLSVAATLGIVLFVEQFPSLPEWKSALALPFVAQFAVMPLQLHQFGSYSLLSPLANLLAAPLVGLVMAGDLATVGAALIHPLLAGIAGTITWLPARLIVGIAEHESGLASTSGTMFTPSWTATFAVYVLLAVAYCAWSMRLKFSRGRRQSMPTGDGI